jgi:fructokinase
MAVAQPQTSPLVIGLGEAVWDIFPDSRRAGGAPGNVAYQVQQLGGRALVATRFGRDEAGRALAEHLAGEGLDLSLVQWDDALPTGAVTVHLEDPAHPHYTIHQPAAWDNLSATPELLGAARRADAICFGTLAQRAAASREAIHEVLAAANPKCLIVYDINLRQHYYDREWIERSLALSKIAKLNHDEVAVVAPLLGLPASPVEFGRALLERRTAVQAVCITRAEEGCTVVTPAEIVEVPGERVNVVDAVGSGDAFSAALIMSLCRGWALKKSIRFANRVGALMATKPGATPRIAGEYAELWKTWDSAL